MYTWINKQTLTQKERNAKAYLLTLVQEKSIEKRIPFRTTLRTGKSTTQPVQSYIQIVFRRINGGHQNNNKKSEGQDRTHCGYVTSSFCDSREAVSAMENQLALEIESDIEKGRRNSRSNIRIYAKNSSRSWGVYRVNKGWRKGVNRGRDGGRDR